MNSEADAPEGRDTEARELGERLKVAREYLNFSQQYVAEHTGIPRTAISDMERGVRRVDSLALRKIARLYQMPASYFLDPQAGADAGEHSVALLARRIMALEPGDIKALDDFVTLMTLRKSARAESTVEDAAEEAET